MDITIRWSLLAWGTVLGVAMLLIEAVTPWPGDEVMGWTLILAP